MYIFMNKLNFNLQNTTSEIEFIIRVPLVPLKISLHALI